MQQKYHGQPNWQALTIFIFGILLLIRLVLSSRLPSLILSDTPHDDAWVVTHALNILKGDWLGPYDQYTLIKGPFSSLLMAFSALIGVSFGGLNTVLYCLACAVFIESVRPIIKNQWLQVLCFAVLLFNPISYALETGQRIYRNGIGQWEILLIFGCLIAVFLRRNQNWKTLFKWTLVCGLSLGAFLQTREDGAWIYPFILGVIASTVVAFLLEKEGPKKKIALFLLPLLIAFLLNGTTMIANYVFYGVPIVNDRNGGNYAKVAGDLYAIAPDADEDRLYKSEAYKGQYYNIYVSTMDKAFAASPTLNGASQPIRDAIRMWASWEGIKNGQVSTDHMLFALRDGVAGAGYYKSLPETEAFYGRVHEELKKAFENGALVKWGFPVSPLMKRLQKPDIGKALSLMPMAIRTVVDFSGVGVGSVPAIGSPMNIKQFGLVAGGDYYTSPGLFIGSGWAFIEDDKIHLNAGLYDKHGVLISALPFSPGEDVFNSTKVKYQNAKMSRFSFRLDGYDLKSGVTFRFFDQNANLLWEVPADGSVTCVGASGTYHFCLDELKGESSPEKFYAPLVGRANYVVSGYQLLSPLFSLLSCIVYFAITGLVVWGIYKKQILKKTLSVWLILTGLGLSFLIFMFIMCLITATSFNALIYLYTAPAYLLLLMFCSVSVSWAIQAIFSFMGDGQRLVCKREIKMAPTPLSHPKYRADIDGLRAIAVLAVVAFHAFPQWITGGFIGVDIFFVISGYLISTIIFENLDGDTFSFTRFYARRILRIFPALILVFISCFAFGWFALFADEFKQLGKHIATGSAFVSNIALWNESGYFDNAVETKPLLHLWSLGVEEQFYIVWPFILYFAYKKGLNLLIISILVALASFYLNIHYAKTDLVADFYSPQTRFWELMLGSMLAWMTVHRPNLLAIIKTGNINRFFAKLNLSDQGEDSGATLASFISIVAFSLIIFGFYRINKDIGFPGAWALIPVLGAVLLIYSGPKAWVNRHILSNKYVVWFGLISFPLYLWHWPLLSFARILEGKRPDAITSVSIVLFSIVLAWLTYMLIERPIRFGKYDKFKVVILLALMIIVGYVGYNTYSRNGLPFRIKEAIAGKNAMFSDENTPWLAQNQDARCKSKYPGFPGSYCRMSKEGDPTIQIIGDSHALAFYPGLRDESNSTENILYVGDGGCVPLFNVATINDAKFNEVDHTKNHCMHIANSAIEIAEKNNTHTNILWFRGLLYLENNVQIFSVSQPKLTDKDSIIKAGLRETLDRLIAKKNRLIVVLDNPELNFDPKSCSIRPLELASYPKICAIARKDFDDASRRYRELIVSVLKDYPSIMVFDSAEQLCDQQWCWTIKNEKMMYRDDDHLSLDGAKLQARELLKLLH